MSAAMGFFFLAGTQKRVRNNRGNRAISVRATEVLLYNACTCTHANTAFFHMPMVKTIFMLISIFIS